MRTALSLFLLMVALAPGLPAAAWAQEGDRQQEKQLLRTTEQRLTRLAQAGDGARLTKAEKQRIKLAAHVQYAIQAEARRAGVGVAPAEVDRLLRAWGIPAAAGDPAAARSYGEVEQAHALRGVAEARLLFEKLAPTPEEGRRVYAALIQAHAAGLPEEGFQLSDILKNAPALLGAFAGGGNGESDAAALLGQAFSSQPGRMARQLEKSAEAFDGNPDNLPLLYPNTALEAREAP